jgi:hypothetical protein
MIPLITDALLSRVSACDRAELLLSLPECPPLPLALDEALALVDFHMHTPGYAHLKDTAAASMRWLTAKMLSEAVYSVPADVRPLHFPRLGIFVDDGGQRTVVTDPETLTLVLATATDVGLLLAHDSHVILVSGVWTAFVTAQNPDDRWHASVCATVPGSRVVYSGEPVVVARLKHRQLDGADVWFANGAPCSAPY